MCIIKKCINNCTHIQISLKVESYVFEISQFLEFVVTPPNGEKITFCNQYENKNNRQNQIYHWESMKESCQRLLQTKNCCEHSSSRTTGWFESLNVKFLFSNIENLKSVKIL